MILQKEIEKDQEYSSKETPNGQLFGGSLMNFFSLVIPLKNL